MKNSIRIERNHCIEDIGFSIAFMKWFSWGYGIISSVLFMLLKRNGIFDKMDYPDPATNMWLTGGMSLFTLAFLFFLFENIFKRKHKALSIFLSLSLVVISNLVFWLAIPSCIDAAESFFLEHSADYEYYTERPFQDKYNRILLFCFFPYTSAAFVWFISIAHKRFLLIQDASNNKRQKVAYCLMFPIFYFIVASLTSAYASMATFALIPLQLLSLIWRDCKKKYLTFNFLCYLNVAILLILDNISGSEGFEPIIFWIEGSVLFLAYLSAILFTLTKLVRNKVTNKKIHTV